MKYLVSSIADQDFDPFYPDETIYRLFFSFRLTSWKNFMVLL
jgi:hypothetical protein